MLHNRIDPHSQGWGYYECPSCGHRETEGSRPGACPACGGEVRNLAVSRE